MQSKDSLCNIDETDKENYLKIEKKLYEFIKSVPQYRLKFKEELLKDNLLWEK